MLVKKLIMISRIAVASVHLIAMKPKFKSRKLELLEVYQKIILSEPD